MERKKEDYLVIAFGAILVIIILVIAVVATNYSRNDQQPTPSTEPTPSTKPVSGNTRPPLLYDEAAQNTLLDRIQKRKELSDDDRFAKAKILSLLPANTPSGIVYQSQNIIIDYTKSADVIQVEILTTDIQAAKNEANIWLRTQGLSQDAICNLPVAFYLNYDVASQIRNTDVVFSPLANGCQ